MTRERAIEYSFERVAAMFAPVQVSSGSHGSNGPNGSYGSNGSNGSNGAVSADSEVTLTLEQLHRSRYSERDLDNFIQAVRLAVAADQESHRLTSEEVARELNLDELATIKLGRLLALSPEVCRDSGVEPGYSTRSFLPSH